MPESFLAIHSRHGRALLPRAEMQARYELCEDVALHAAALLASRHQPGDDTADALRHCHAGLRQSGDVSRADFPRQFPWILRWGGGARIFLSTDTTRRMNASATTQPGDEGRGVG